ncbi:hypothetical protein [Chitinimonas lacunae]|uniref:Uncharacterized protein n=1 Tax=Chitinimonas lacunae TaxID=1963018 RepID=A0ABV8MJA5_9NEIS
MAEDCPRCGLALGRFHANSHLPGQVREIVRCPHCQYQEAHELVPGTIEAEPDHFLLLRPTPRPTLCQLQALRAVAEAWRELPLAMLKSRLATEAAVKLGPYGRKYLAEAARRQLEAAGWEVSLE